MPGKSKCPICGAAGALVERPREYRYDNCGLSNVLLVGNGVTVLDCGRCGNVTTLVASEQQLHQVLGLMLVCSPPGMKGEELRYLRTLFGMTQAELAAELRLSRRPTVAEWERQGRIFKRPVDEIPTRVMLLGLFKSRIIDSDRCFLVERHRKQYEKFASSFAPNISRILDEQRRAQFSVRHQPRIGFWTLELLAA